MVFQDPDGSLNPAPTVGKSLTEPLEAAAGIDAGTALGMTRSLLDKVLLPEGAADRILTHSAAGSASASQTQGRWRLTRA
ncbi:hypothetical protein [Paenarthrobacter nitroguajacolicus]|uniref:hypothetical protein n=1 Tax=Paenarthrobacter nitroguajacolicus TaxID=211146 RepID=UPI00286785E9|nr:hypothetical protein [Paenarthrobacter nitroguajacolicus]MDR6639474.1 ABC-type dipeptide/oligopeptide/nickel transport system ATPase subunit [Paenarthrobacter nitroguajacolicus]